MINFFKTDNNELLNKELLKDFINEKKIQKLIDGGVDINKKDSKGRTLLFELVRKKRIEAIKLLIKNGSNIDIEDNYGKTVLSEAVDKNDSMIIRFLLGLGANVNYINSSGRTLLQDVALEGNTKIFNTLMQYDPDLNIRDAYGKTVLFDAVEGASLQIVKEILLNIDEPNIKDEKGNSILFYASLLEQKEILKHLIAFGLDINLLNDDNQNIMYNLVLYGADNFDIIEDLISKDIKINIKDSADKSLLDEILKILSLIKDPKIKRTKKYNVISEKRDYIKLTSILIENGLAVNRKDSQGKTVIFREVKRKNYDTLNFLLSSGANVNVEDNEGRTVLFDACFEGFSNSKMIDYLLENGADLDHRDFSEKSIIDDLIELVLIQENNKRPSSRRFLEVAHNGEYMELLKRVLLQKPKINIPRSDGKTAIFDIITHNNLELIRVLLNSGIDPNILDNDGHTPLVLLVEEGLKLNNSKDRELFLERIVFLLKYRIRMDMIDKDGRTVFHKAVMAEDFEVVEKLLTKKSDLNIRDKQGRTALHHTQWKGNFKIARLLIANGANMNETDYAGFTLLNYAAILGHTNLVIILLASGVLMYNRNKKSKAVARFFKEKEAKLENLLHGKVTDEKMRNSLQQVIDNLKKEINEALK